ncbi:hypothetical protein BKP43_36800 [Variovorax boronicumulans]|uniref:hypothetical protein n=1 Tax=Variovorax boronicumulans TaxID=436515 RepID=UPI000BB3CAF8|nr:hypothetical protein [Variovorax boronicumulans]PBI88207.1 hypothetical protein BKP43_36800 [Variovorax boronicumulans]
MASPRTNVALDDNNKNMDRTVRADGWTTASSPMPADERAPFEADTGATRAGTADNATAAPSDCRVFLFLLRGDAQR